MAYTEMLLMYDHHDHELAEVPTSISLSRTRRCWIRSSYADIPSLAGRPGKARMFGKACFNYDKWLRKIKKEFDPTMPVTLPRMHRRKNDMRCPVQRSTMSCELA